jgi:capsular exopolysaccharide synthesis family protein
MEIQGYIAAIARRWKIVVLAAVLGGLVGLGLSLATTPLYQSSAQLFLSAPTTDATRDDDLFTRNRIPSYAALIKGEQLAQRVLDVTQLPSTAAELARQVSVTSNTDTVLMAISVTDTSPERAQFLADAYATEFGKLVAELEAPVDGGPPLVRSTLVEPARLPTSPVVPRTLLNVGLGGALGLLLGIGAALIRDHRDDTVKVDWSASESSGSPVLGTVAIESSWPKNLGLDLSAAALASAEAFRTIRTNLQSPHGGRIPQVLVVTGAVPGAGATSLVANLARVYANAGRSVTLVDGDLTERDSSLTKYLELDSSIGLTDVLSNSASASEAFKHLASYAGGGSLGMLGSGSPVPGSRELLFSDEMDSVLRSLRESADLVLIDSPPLLHVSDAVALAQKSDGAIIVAQLRRTKRRQLRAAAAGLRDAGANVRGLILISSIPRPPSRFRCRQAGKWWAMMAARARRPQGTDNFRDRRDFLSPTRRWYRNPFDFKKS